MLSWFIVFTRCSTCLFISNCFTFIVCFDHQIFFSRCISNDHCRDWQRVTLPLPFAVLQQDFIRFRISAPAGSMSIYSNNDAWAIEKGETTDSKEDFGRRQKEKKLCFSFHRSMSSSLQWPWIMRMEFMSVSCSFRKELNNRHRYLSCDPGYEGDFCEMTNTTLIHRATYLFEQQIENETDLIYYQGELFDDQWSFG